MGINVQACVVCRQMITTDNIFSAIRVTGEYGWDNVAIHKECKKVVENENKKFVKNPVVKRLYGERV